MKEGLKLFFMQILLNFIGTVNMISTAEGDYLWTGVSDFFLALLGFYTLVIIIPEKDRIVKLTGFLFGAILGSLVGIYFSKSIQLYK